MRTTLFTMGLVFALVACGGDDDGGGGVDGGNGGGDAAMADADGCNKLWGVTITDGVDAEAVIRNFGLELSVTQAPAATVGIEVSQIGVSGDFDLVLTVEGYASGGNGGYARAALLHQGGPPGRRAVAGLVTIPQTGVIALIDRDGMTPMQEVRPTSATSGTFEFARTGDLLTVTTTAGGVVATQEMAAFGFSPFKLAIQLGNDHPDNVLSGETTLRVTDFAYTGPPGQVAGDPFACNSLRN